MTVRIMLMSPNTASISGSIGCWSSPRTKVLTIMHSQMKLLKALDSTKSISILVNPVDSAWIIFRRVEALMSSVSKSR